MTYRPPEAGVLVFGHGLLAFFESRDRQGIGKSERSARFRFKEELVRHTAVLVFMTSSLADVLEKRGQFHLCVSGRKGLLTDLVTGAFGISEGWKLNTPLESSTMSVLP